MDKADKGQLLFLDFYSPDCGPCQTMIPILDELKSILGNQLEFSEIDISAHPPIALRFKIKSTPTFILFENGKELWRHTGLITLKRLNESLSKLL